MTAASSPPPIICSMDGCKRAVTCLCRHCQKDVCSKHFNEHQIQVNNELIPITDRLNELKMRLRINDNDPTSPLAMLKIWRDKKYKEIDEEYNHKIEELNRKISIHDNEITRTISYIQELLNDGDVSIDQVKQMEQTVENLTNQVNNLLINQSSDLIGTYIRLGNLQYLVKARILCENIDLYALESEKPLTGYDGICPQCNKTHTEFELNRGMYVLAKTIHAKIPNLK